MHPRSKHLVLFIILLIGLIILVGFLVNVAQAPEDENSQLSASVIFAETTNTYRVEKTERHSHSHARAAFIEKVRESLPEDTPDAASYVEEVPEPSVDPVDVPLSEEAVYVIPENLSSPIPAPTSNPIVIPETIEVPVETQMMDTATQTPYDDAHF